MTDDVVFIEEINAVLICCYPHRRTWPLHEEPRVQTEG